MGVHKNQSQGSQTNHTSAHPINGYINQTQNNYMILKPNYTTQSIYSQTNNRVHKLRPITRYTSQSQDRRMLTEKLLSTVQNGNTHLSIESFESNCSHRWKWYPKYSINWRHILKLIHKLIACTHMFIFKQIFHLYTFALLYSYILCQ